MSKKINKEIIYFDNNGTTLICDKAKNAFNKWMSSYNPSSDSKLSEAPKNLLKTSQEKILNHCGVSSATHTVIFTSGGTESNCFIIRACYKAFKKKLLELESDDKPHIILSAIEHYSSLECVKDLLELKEIEVSYVQPTIYGNILSKDIEREIKYNTCLISVMFANNEIPTINNIKEIGAIAHKHKIPMHSDCVQVFGKFKINLIDQNIDALSASAHKFYGPKGIGLLILNNDLIEGYKLTAEISGSQQSGLRGGTENVAGVASLMAAMNYAFENRQKKNNHLYNLRVRCLELLAEHYKFVKYEDYDPDNFKKIKLDSGINLSEIELISLGPPPEKKAFILPNTILLAICKKNGKPFCNIDLKKYLDLKNCAVSIGSVCLTKSEKASHVVQAIHAPAIVKRGIIRISFGDNNTLSEVDKFVKHVINGINKQCR